MTGLFIIAIYLMRNTVFFLRGCSLLQSPHQAFFSSCCELTWNSLLTMVLTYRRYFAPEYRLAVKPDSNSTNNNSREYLEGLQQRMMEHLRNLAPAPSVAFHERPPDIASEEALRPETMTSPRRPMMRLWSGDHSRDEGGLGSPTTSKKMRVDLSFKTENGHVEDVSPAVNGHAGGS
jgi:hypothetical protein